MEKQRRLDKLGKGGVMDPRELFGCTRKSSADKNKGILDAFSTVTTATNATVEKTDEFVGEMGIQGGGGNVVVGKEGGGAGSFMRR